MSHKIRAAIGTAAEAHNLASAADYRELARVFVVRSGLGGLHERSERPPAYVSAGRWVVDCPCGNGPAAHPGGAEGWPDPVAVCLECGAVYRPVFPRDREAGEAALLAREHPHQRHWFPHASVAARRGLARAETVRGLLAENKARGVR